jgi:2-phosphoglycerate kinase
MDEPLMSPARSWQVLLLGGASAVGKTAVSYRLARHFGIGLTEVDDFQVLLETMTTPEQQPALHFWRTHPAPDALSAQAIME